MEYRDLQDNIRLEEFNERTSSVLEWIKENRDKYEWAKDPNAYEMTNIFLLGAKYASKEEGINLGTLEEMWKIRSKDFANVGIGEENFVYRICEDSYKSAMNKRPLVNDEASHHALRKMSGLGLFLMQHIRDRASMQYDNPQELLELIEASKTLRNVHPDLFNKYRFMENIETIVKLQPERALSQKINEEIAMLKQERTSQERLNVNNKGNKSLEEK